MQPRPWPHWPKPTQLITPPHARGPLRFSPPAQRTSPECLCAALQAVVPFRTHFSAAPHAFILSRSAPGHSPSASPVRVVPWLFGRLAPCATRRLSAASHRTIRLARAARLAQRGASAARAPRPAQHALGQAGQAQHSSARLSQTHDAPSRAPLSGRPHCSPPPPFCHAPPHGSLGASLVWIWRPAAQGGGALFPGLHVPVVPVGLRYRYRPVRYDLTRSNFPKFAKF